MSESKILPLRPKRTMKVRQLVLFGVLFLVVVAAVCCLLMPEQLNLDAVGRLFKYVGKRDADSYGTIDYHAGESAGFAAFSDGLLIGNENGLVLYDCDGAQRAELQGAFPGALVQAGDRLALCYTAGGDTLLGMNSRGEQVFEYNSTGKLLDAAVSPSGACCYLTAESSYKTVANVRNAKGEECYKWYSSTQYLGTCAISGNGDYLALVGLGQEQSSFHSSLILLNTRQTEPIAEVDLGGQLIYDLEFLGKESLCAVGEQSVMFLGADGTLLREVPYEGMLPERFGFSDEGYVSILFNENPSGSKTWLAVYDAGGNELSRSYLGYEVHGLSVCGRYTAVLSAGRVSLFNRRGRLYAQTDAVGNASRVLARKDGTVLLTDSEKTVLWIP